MQDTDDLANGVGEKDFDIDFEIPHIFTLWIHIDGFWRKLEHWTEFRISIYLKLFFFAIMFEFSPFQCDGGANLTCHLWLLPKFRKSSFDK